MKKRYGDGLYKIKEKETAGSERKMIEGLEQFEKNNKMNSDIELII